MPVIINLYGDSVDMVGRQGWFGYTVPRVGRLVEANAVRRLLRADDGSYHFLL